MNRSIIIAAALFCAAGLYAQDTQKLRLPPTSIPRFSISQMETPPANHGEAKVCIWNEDKIGVASFGIDGNYTGSDDGIWPRDHEYWLAVMDTFGLRMTFYVIGNAPHSGKSNWSTWDDVRELYAAGHSIQSHTMYHLPGDYNYYIEYKESKDILEREMPYDICHVIGYAGGQIPNHVDSAMIWYNGGRGLTGIINKADRINYQDSGNKSWDNSYSEIKAILGEDPGQIQFKYGVVTGLTHNIPAAERQSRWADWKYFKSKEDVLWFAGHEEFIQYGQERDTHTLTVNSATADVITFSLTDEMCDTVFLYPLTVKVRVDNSWSDAVAVQGGKTVWHTMKIDGDKYVLVKAVPDQGEVTVIRAGAVSSTVVANPVIDSASGTYADGVTVGVACATAGATIRYTTDGSDPTESSTAYGSDLSITVTTTLKVRAYKAGLAASAIMSAMYTVPVDNVQPSIVRVVGGSETAITIVYDEPVAAADAEDASNYVIPGLTVSAAALGTDNSRVILTVSAMTHGTDYDVAIGSVTDRADAPNTIENIGAGFTYRDNASTGAAMHFKCDGNLDDASGNNFSASWKDVAAYAPGISGECLEILEGDHVNVALPGPVVLSNISTVTLCAWGKKADPFEIGELVYRHTVFSLLTSGDGVTGSMTPIDGSATKVISRAYTDDTDWHHYAVTYDGTTVSTYVDGQPIATGTMSGPVRDNTNQDMQIGKYPWGTAFNGWIDEVRVYDAALSATEIRDIYLIHGEPATVSVTDYRTQPGALPMFLPNPLSPAQVRTLPGTMYRMNGRAATGLESGVYLWHDGTQLRKILISK